MSRASNAKTHSETDWPRVDSMTDEEIMMVTVGFDSTRFPPIKYPLTKLHGPHAIENLSKTATIHLVPVELQK